MLRLFVEGLAFYGTGKKTKKQALTNASGITSRQNRGERSFIHVKSVPAQRSIRSNPTKKKKISNIINVRSSREMTGCVV